MTRGPARSRCSVPLDARAPAPSGDALQPIRARRVNPRPTVSRAPFTALAVPLLVGLASSSCIFYIRADRGDFELDAQGFDSHDWRGTRVRGNGVAASEVRACYGMRALDIAGAVDVDVRLGATESVRVRGDENVLDHVVTELHGDHLEVRLRKGSYELRERLVVEVTLPALERLDLSGSGDAEVSGFDGGDLAIALSGSGDIELEGRVDRLSIDVAGSGDVDARHLDCGDASVRVTGSGDVALGATGSLDAEITGSGDVTYGGSPSSVRTEVKGSGTVRLR